MYNAIIGFVILLVVVIFLACIFWNAGCTSVIAIGGCGCHNNVRKAVSNGAATGANVAVAGVAATGAVAAAGAVGAAVMNGNSVQPGWPADPLNPNADSVTEPFVHGASGVTPCDQSVSW